MFQIEMTTAAGETELGGATFETRDEAEREMAMRRSLGEYTDGRDDSGDMYPPNATYVVAVQVEDDVRERQ